MATDAEARTTEARSVVGGICLRRLRFGGLLLFLGIRSPALGCGQPSELECEELAQHMVDCCGGSVGLQCEHLYEERASTPGCGTAYFHSIRRAEPDFSGDDARCVRRASCEALQQAGACKVRDWLGPDRCTGTVLDVTDCSTPSQVGRCESYRPIPTCQVLRQLDCAPP